MASVHSEWKINDFSENYFKISDEDARYMRFMYSRLVEEKVINSIKHTENGSAGFQMFYLKNMISPENSKLVHESLTRDMGMKNRSASRLMKLVNWAHHTGFLKSVKAYLSLYNKGKGSADDIDSDHLEVLDKCTFFGSLLKEITDLQKVVSGHLRMEDLSPNEDSPSEEGSSVKAFGSEYDFLPDLESFLA